MQSSSTRHRRFFMLSAQVEPCYWDEDDSHVEWAGMNEPGLIGDIVAANEKGDSEAFERSVVYFNKFLRGENALSEAFLESPVVDILAERVREGRVSEQRVCRLSLLCLYYLTLFEHLSEFLVERGVVDVFVEVLRGPVMPICACALDGIRNLGMDVPEVIEKLHESVGVCFFLESVLKGSASGFKRLEKYALLETHLARLLACFSATKLSGKEVTMMVRFYLALLESDSSSPKLCENSLVGLFALAKHGKLGLVDASLFDKFPDVIELAVPDENSNVERENSNVETAVAACHLVRKLLKCNIKLDFSMRTVLELCDRFFDKDVGVAAYKLVYGITKYGDDDELMDLCMNGLPVLVRGINDGTFAVRHSSTEAMLRVIDGTDYTLVCCFLKTEGCLPALLKLLEFEQYAQKVVEQLNIIFERCVQDEIATDFASAFFEHDGIDVIEQFLAEQHDDKSIHYGNRLLERIKEFV